MGKNRKQCPAPTDEQNVYYYTMNLRQFVTLCVIIAIVAFALGVGATLGLQSLRNSDIYITETNAPEVLYTFVPEKQPTETQEPIVSKTPNTDNSNTTAAPTPQSSVAQKDSDEYILQNPESSTRFNTIDDRDKFHDKIQLMYFNDEWNGEPMVLDGHYVSLSSSGRILADMHSLNFLKTVDLPINFDTRRIDSCNLQYIPGHGTYFVDGETYFKCVNGEEIELGTLNWMDIDAKIDTLYHHPFICYDKVNSKMFLWTPMNDYGPYSESTLPDYTYLYILPNYDIAKMEFVAKVKVGSVDFDEKGIKYMDLDGTVCRYST